MKPFAYTRATDTGESLAAFGAAVRPYAGGTDLLTRMKLGISTPERLLDIKSLDLPRGIERDGDTLRLGALTTLVEIERHDFPPALALLAEAAAKAATPQLRERATLGAAGTTATATSIAGSRRATAARRATGATSSTRCSARDPASPCTRPISPAA